MIALRIMMNDSWHCDDGQVNGCEENIYVYLQFETHFTRSARHLSSPPSWRRSPPPALLRPLMGRCVLVLITIIIVTNIKIMIIIKMTDMISRQVSLVSWVYKTGQGSGFRWESHKFAKYCRWVSVYDFVAPSLFCFTCLFCCPTPGDPWAEKRAEVEEDWLHQVAWLQDY